MAVNGNSNTTKKAGKGQNLINVEKVDKTFRVGDQDVEVLRKVDLQVNAGDFMIIFGASGSGKSTLLHILLGLEEPTAGKVMFLKDDLYANTDEDYRSAIRKKHIGMVYQQSNWIKALTVAENIAFPLQLLGMEKSLAVERAHEMLKRIKMYDWANYVPTELSSGQQQRISLARALIHNPMIVVADEPTGNLDFESGQEIMALLKEMNKKQDKTVIMVTHDLDYLDYSDIAVQVFDGEIVGVYDGEDKKQIAKKIKTKKIRSTLNDDSNDKNVSLEKEKPDKHESSKSKKSSSKDEGKE